MDILVTGASGFIGGHLVRHWQGSHRLYALGRGPVAGTIHIPADLGRPVDPSIIPRHVDVVVHLATAQRDPLRLQRVDVDATAELLAVARARGAHAFVLSSTGAVYGWRHDDATEEAPLAPADDYARAKVAAEAALEGGGNAVGTVALRMFMPYGPGQRRRLFADLVSRVREHRPVELANGGAPILNPIHVEDLLAVFDRALVEAGHVVLNVGGNEALSIKEMAEVIGRALAIEPVFELREGSGPARLVGRIDRLRGWLGYGPRLTFEEGVARSIGSLAP